MRLYAMKSKILIFVLSLNCAFSQSPLLEKYLKNCESFQLTGQIDSVRKYAILAFELAGKENLLKYQSRAEYFRGNSLLRTYPDSSFKILNRVYNQLIQNDDFKYLTLATNSLGNYYGKIGQNTESIKYYNKAREYADKYYTKFETERYPRIIAVQYFNIAQAYIEMSDNNLALENMLKAAKVANQYKLKPIELGCLITMGNLYEKLGQIEYAEKSYLEAKELAIELKDLHRTGVVYSNLGSIFNSIAEKNPKNKSAFARAKNYLEEALKIARQQNDNTSISIRLSNLGSLEKLRKNYKKAEEYLLEALNYANISKSKISQLAVMASLSQNYLALDKTKEAIETANQAIEIAKEIKNSDNLPKLYGILEKAYTKEKDFVKALEFQKAQMESKDSLFKTSTTAKIIELQTKYETEKKQREIELLTLQNQTKEAEIKQKNYLILAITLGILMLLGGFFFWNRQRNLKEKQQAAEMKQRLLRAQLNPHFLFNCLNSIQRLYVDGRTSQANDFIADFAQLMRDILEKTGRTTIPLYEEIDFIEAYLSLEKRRLGDKFEYEIVMDDEIRHSDMEVPSFIVQPLAENALLHGVLPKNQKGKIEILVDKLADESLSITIKDDGVGFYQSMQKAGKHTSRGMELIRTRLGKKGKMLIEEIKNLNQEILGTKVILQIAP